MSNIELRSNATQKCPKCGSAEWKPLGFPGAIWKAILIGLFSWIGVLIGDLEMKRRKDNDPFILKCQNCGKKWKISPSEAAQEEWLEIPCEITINRPKRFAGSAGLYFIILNGIRVGALKNGASLSFQTNLKHNILYCAIASGTVFADCRRFEAEPGGHIDFDFNGKFL